MGSVREAVRSARRVVKVGSSSLTTAEGGLDPQRIEALTDTLAYRRGTGGEVVLVSSGAIAAGLAPLRMSLLPAGVTGVDGDFVAGDPVNLVDESGDTVARGLVNFDAGELPGLLGRQTHRLAAELGPAYPREVVHRDDIVIVGTTRLRGGADGRSAGGRSPRQSERPDRPERSERLGRPQRPGPPAGRAADVARDRHGSR